jgi:hypothetical protein
MCFVQTDGPVMEEPESTMNDGDAVVGLPATNPTRLDVSVAEKRLREVIDEIHARRRDRPASSTAHW